MMKWMQEFRVPRFNSIRIVSRYLNDHKWVFSFWFGEGKYESSVNESTVNEFWARTTHTHTQSHRLIDGTGFCGNMLSHKYFDKIQFKFNWLYACVFCFCFCRSRSTRILSISALKTDDCESMKCNFKSFHKYTAVHSYNYAKVVRYENELVKKKNAKNVYHFWCHHVLKKSKTLKSFEITSFCPTVSVFRLRYTHAANADRKRSYDYMLIRSLINLDGYQCLCTFLWLCCGHSVRLLVDVMFSTNKTTIYA